MGLGVRPMICPKVPPAWSCIVIVVAPLSPVVGGAGRARGAGGDRFGPVPSPGRSARRPSAAAGTFPVVWGGFPEFEVSARASRGQPPAVLAQRHPIDAVTRICQAQG